MKRIILLALCLSCLLTAAACGNKSDDKSGKKTSGETDPATKQEAPAEPDYEIVEEPALKVNKVVSSEEAAQYKAVFFDKDSSYDNTDVTKTGIFTIVYDKFYNVDRLYVWGYDNDEAKTGWQWEFSVAEGTQLPKAGSEITVTGKFVANDSALDKRWIENASITVVSEYNDALCKYDLTTMSPTLAEQVQVFYLANNTDLFSDDKVALYGEVGENLIINSVNDKESNGETKPLWSFHVANNVLPEAGTKVTAVGTLNGHGQLTVETLYVE